MSDKPVRRSVLQQQIIDIIEKRAGNPERTPAEQADEILALIRGNEPPSGWFHLGSHVDWNGKLELSSEVGEDGLPLWERPLPLGGEELVEDWVPSGSNWRELRKNEPAGGREFVVHGWLAREIDSFHQQRVWVQDDDRPTRWSKRMESLAEDSKVS